LPFDDLPEFLVALQKQEGIAARALEFTILTAARSGEIRGAKPAEINKRERVWTVPAERMKTRKEHRVPLPRRVLVIIEDCGNDEFLFPGRKRGRPMSHMAMTDILQNMGRRDITVHGFRSTFRDWAAERTNFPREVVEMALAHAIENKVEAAYRRGDLFEKRCLLMEEWAKFCSTVPQPPGHRRTPPTQRRESRSEMPSMPRAV
jgi:integrase